MEAICGEKLLVSQILKNISRFLCKPDESNLRLSILFIQDTYLKQTKLDTTVGTYAVVAQKRRFDET